MSEPESSDKPLFPLGRVLLTPGAAEVMKAAGDKPSQYLIRHVMGDYGEISKPVGGKCQADHRASTHAIEHDLRIISNYLTSGGEALWVITESDRSVTTMLLPEEY